MYTIPAMTFAEYLRQRMADMNLNNKGLASLARVSESVVGDWLKGTLPRAETLIRLADTLKVDSRYLFNLAYGLPLPDNNEDDTSDLVREILGMAAQLDEADREELVRFIRFKLLERARKERQNERSGGA